MLFVRSLEVHFSVQMGGGGGLVTIIAHATAVTGARSSHECSACMGTLDDGA